MFDITLTQIRGVHYDRYEEHRNGEISQNAGGPV